jgi:hypothetical protein
MSIGAGFVGLDPVAIPGKNLMRKGRLLFIFTLIGFWEILTFLGYSDCDNFFTIGYSVEVRVVLIISLSRPQLSS